LGLNLSFMSFNEVFAGYVTQTEAAIDRYLPLASTRPEKLHTAMRYAMQGGGKRLRPVLVLAAKDLFNTKAQDGLAAAVAVECVHTYSLIHDDLPCMDNDDLRRGRATVHRAFDEATALLAGDALLTHAFILLSHHYPAAIALNLVRELSSASGSEKLIGGQVEDLLAEKRKDVSKADLEFIHLNKTAAMIECSLVLGAIIAEASHEETEKIRHAGRHLGLAFQIIDDILDVTSDNATLGKTVGKDAKAGKTTFVSMHGLEKSKLLAEASSEAAIAGFKSLYKGSDFFTDLTKSLSQRIT